MKENELIKNILLNLKRFLIKKRTKLFFICLVFSEKYRNYKFKKYLLENNPNFQRNNIKKKNLIMIWEDRFMYLKDQIFSTENCFHLSLKFFFL